MGRLYTIYSQSQDTRPDGTCNAKTTSHASRRCRDETPLQASEQGLIATEAASLPFTIHTHTPEAYRYQQLSRFPLSNASYRA